MQARAEGGWSENRHSSVSSSMKKTPTRDGWSSYYRRYISLTLSRKACLYMQYLIDVRENIESIYCIRIAIILMIIYAFKRYYHFPIDLIWSILYTRLFAVKSIQAYGMTHHNVSIRCASSPARRGAMLLLRHV